jgi:hypothetical protein
MDDEHKICKRFVVVWACVLPALIEEIVEFVPFCKLQRCLQLELDDLEVLRDDVGLGRSS